MREAIRNTYDASKQSKSPGVRRTEELRQLASEGVPVIFESRWKVKVGPLCIWLYAGRWINESSRRSGRINSLSMRLLITRFS